MNQVVSSTLLASFEDLRAAEEAVQALAESGACEVGVSILCRPDIAEAASPAPHGLEIGGMAGTFPDLRVSGPGGTTGDQSIGGLGTRLVGIAASSGASTFPGAMSDFLWSVLPLEMASVYRSEYDQGKILVVVRDGDARAEGILRQHGASRVEPAGG